MHPNAGISALAASLDICGSGELPDADECQRRDRGGNGHLEAGCLLQIGERLFVRLEGGRIARSKIPTGLHGSIRHCKMESVRRA
jgi:hypothetical protein